MEKEKYTKLTRHQQRIKIVERLYTMDIHDDFSHEKTGYGFVDEVLEGLIPALQEVDDLLSKNLVHYTLKRLNYVDRAILRLAAYELSKTQTPVEIVIDEALKITHSLSDEGDKKHVAFNNKVLDNVKNDLKKA